MDGSPSPSQPSALRIQTGDQPALVQQPPQPLPAWVAPAAAGGAVFVGLTVAAFGVLWLCRRPAREPGQDELFEQTAKALGLGKPARASILALAAKSSGVPSPTGLAMWS